MLPTHLNTNEVKNAAGTEVEYTRQRNDGRSVTFSKTGGAPNLAATIKISHETSGAGIKQRRRSLFRVDTTSMSEVDPTLPVVDSGYVVVDTAEGAHNATTAVKAVISALVSMLASTGADTTVKFDCSGTAADALANGTL